MTTTLQWARTACRALANGRLGVTATSLLSGGSGCTIVGGRWRFSRGSLLPEGTSSCGPWDRQR